MFERYYRWYPVLYDNFVDYHVKVNLPDSCKAFAFVPADSVVRQDSRLIQYFTLYDEDFPMFVTTLSPYKFTNIKTEDMNFNFYFVAEGIERVLKRYTFTTDPHLCDSLLQIIQQRCIKAFYWYRENLWFQPIEEINFIETTMFDVGFGFGNFVLYDSDLINLDLYWKSYIAHEIAHFWIGLHTQYEVVGRYFLYESITSYISYLFYESMEGKEFMEQIIEYNKRHVTEEGMLPFTITFDDFLNKRKHSDAVALAAIYGKGPVFLHEFRKLIGKETFLKIIRETYSHPNKLLTLKDFEKVVKRNHCWKAYQELYKMGAL
jgi:hypothetical protein